MLTLFSCELTQDMITKDEYLKDYIFNFKHWGVREKSAAIILAIHGYNDHSGSFKIPANFFQKFNIYTTAFDLRGFGRNEDLGEWYPLSYHINDIKEKVLNLKKENPSKDIFLMGESMGGAILISLLNLEKNLPIEGVILIAPAIWNFTERNFFKSLSLNLLSKIFPNLSLSGKGVIKIKASNNQKMLKELSEDPFFVHKPKIKSLHGVVELMDKSYNDAILFFKKPPYKTLLLIPIIDDIVPRKPLIELLREPEINDNLGKMIDLAVYKSSYHMILRDINSELILRQIKDWTKNTEDNFIKNNYENSYKTLLNEPFYHILDK